MTVSQSDSKHAASDEEGVGQEEQLDDDYT